MWQIALDGRPASPRGPRIRRCEKVADGAASVAMETARGRRKGRLASPGYAANWLLRHLPAPQLWPRRPATRTRLPSITNDTVTAAISFQ